MTFLCRLSFFLLIILMSSEAAGQRIGLVLSGGGVRGMAHIGVLRALEENNIPVDYITGTSAGALVGAMYSTGLSPVEMQSVVLTNEFRNRASGDFNEENLYFFLKNPPDPSWISIKLIADSILRIQLPSNVVNPGEIDFALMQSMAAPIAAANYNFDSLMVPFRCVAADISNKEPVIFSSGDLALAVRASMAFPFYYAPVLRGNDILYDGGIYNNFPSDIMLKEFNPDVMIGVSVAGYPELPVEGNFLSQLKTMITQTTHYELPREQDVMIEPNIRSIGTFDFNAIQAIIDSGYAAGLQAVPHLKELIARRADADSLNMKRQAITGFSKDISIDAIYVHGVNSEQAAYIRAVLNPRNQCLNLHQLHAAWFKLVADDNLRYLFPRLVYNPASHNYDLHIDVKKNKGLFLDFGGVVSSRPINMGYVALQHNFWGWQSLRLNANIYFGKLYSSGQLRLRMDVPGILPFYFEPSVTLNNFDYYKSSSAFFEDVKPSFLVQYDRNFSLAAGIPAHYKGKVTAGGNWFELRDRYYLTRDFNQSDTADVTEFNGWSGWISFERNTLNRKMYANEGTFFEMKMRYTAGTEHTVPGSTGLLRDTTERGHSWPQMKVTYDNYFKRFGPVQLGFYSELSFSSQPFFSTYTSSVAEAPVFQPLPDMQTRFLEQFHAYSYVGAGLKAIVRVNTVFDLRFESYVFQPFQEILPGRLYRPEYGDAFNKRYYIGSLNPVYYSPIGPVSLSLNYYENLDRPVTLMFHLGYILFNKRALQ